ncbi:universal stress protein [Paraburkholderia kururiensis]|uniref:Universal stress protein n=1 Tax=Paraburkholderia kururiensis TaxID=984307 RepID=A0ABZ0WHN0_9BURK|nr:universal stress protein [Paraburkholderia kururiensis]WQD76838.1 universal stress protein [Paraburkholderia kururiensis]
MNAVTSTDTPFALPTRVLIAVDASAASQQALAYVQNLLRPENQVRLVSVAENPRTLVPTGGIVGATLEVARAELRRDAADALGHAKGLLAACKAAIETEVVDLSQHGGSVVDTLMAEAHAWHADLLVVGARQHHGVMRWVEGTVSEPLARLARCPILVVPERFEVQPGQVPTRIFFALDASGVALQALRYGMRFATRDSHVHAVYVVDRAVRLSDLVPIDMLESAFIDEGKAVLANAEPILGSATSSATTALLKTERAGDDIAHTIVRAADHWHAQLVVMGTHGRRGMARWALGSVAQRVAQLTHVPLLLVHSQEA